ncbi:MAG: hypothetical protein CMF61_01475 [Magnetococcales bacterium]|nr:hypothetical protein [Magnetococcales bacterium]
MNTAETITTVKSLIIAAVNHVSYFNPRLKQGECTDIESGILTDRFLHTAQCSFMLNSMKRQLANKGIQIKTTFEPAIGESYHKLKIEAI